MIAVGHMQNGVVVLNRDVQLPDGTEVTVIAPSTSRQESHSVLDIPTVSLGAVLRPLTPVDDLLEEMLEGRT